jgi:hypothetical protein
MIFHRLRAASSNIDNKKMHISPSLSGLSYYVIPHHMLRHSCTVFGKCFFFSVYGVGGQREKSLTGDGPCTADASTAFRK